MSPRAEYIIDEQDWDDSTRLAALRHALDVVEDSVVFAETDIPWHKRDEWPEEVVIAASVLRSRFAGDSKDDDDYLQTAREPVDDETRHAFITFAPYAYACTLWGPDGEVASVNDEGTSIVVFLDDAESERLRSVLGPNRVFSAAEWRERHPATLRRLVRRLRHGR